MAEISKHLMLLFNNTRPTDAAVTFRFQNISCYYLTELNKLMPDAPIRFQNISCYYLTSREIFL